MSVCGIIRSARRIWRIPHCDKSEREIRVLSQSGRSLLSVPSRLAGREAAIRVCKYRSACVRQGSIHFDLTRERFRIPLSVIVLKSRPRWVDLIPMRHHLAARQ